jgi:hypothetical protein
MPVSVDELLKPASVSPVPKGTKDLGQTSSILGSQQVGGQSFYVEVVGLNINTEMNVYLDGRKLGAFRIQPYRRLLGTNLLTDEDGDLRFTFYYTDVVPSLANIPEAEFVNAVHKNTKLLSVVVVDRASINDLILPATFRKTARCYAERDILRTYEIQLTTVKDVIDVRTGGVSRTTLGTQTLIS